MNPHMDKESNVDITGLRGPCRWTVATEANRGYCTNLPCDHWHVKES